MTKAAALHKFFNQFLPFYPSTNVPEDVVFPYGTYTPVFDAWGGEPVSLTVNLWYYTESEAIPNAKAQEISEHIGFGGTVVRFDGGYIWITRGTPFVQSLSDDTAPSIKRRYLNVTAEYLTLN